jgi:hypothetical protein
MIYDNILNRSKHEKRHITLHTTPIRTDLIDGPRKLKYELLNNAHTLRRQFKKIDHMLHDIY